MIMFTPNYLTRSKYMRVDRVGALFHIQIPLVHSLCLEPSYHKTMNQLHYSTLWCGHNIYIENRRGRILDVLQLESLQI